ncbi:MAG: dienelactone hydrolase family protein [Desulfobacterales bacterium]
MKYVIVVCMLITFPVAGTAGEFVAYTVNDQDLEGYMTGMPAEAPLILLIHDWDGLTDYEVKRADMLGERGYAVFAADLFGVGVRPTAAEDKRRITSELMADRETMLLLMYGALEAAQSKGARIDNAVAMGYCFGGTAVLELAGSGADLKGFVTFHGGLETPEGRDYTRTKGKVLVFHGTADRSVSMEQFAELADAFEEKNVDHEMITYGGAPHAFTVFGTDRYREHADKKSWRRFLVFLKETLGTE